MILNCAEILKFTTMKDLYDEFPKNSIVESTPPILKSKKFNIVASTDEDGTVLIVFNLDTLDSKEPVEFLRIDSFSIYKLPKDKLIELCRWNIDYYIEHNNDYLINKFKDMLKEAEEQE